MRYLRNKRGLAGLGALAAVIGVTLWVVLPAFASNPGDLVGPASYTQHVFPTDVAIGGNGACSNLFPNLGGVSEYDNPNPKTGTYSSGNSDEVQFDVTMDPTVFPTPPAYARDRYMNVSVETGGASATILGIGINGGTDSTTYTYPGVSSDTALHAPAQSWSLQTSGGITYEWPSQLYSISHLTVCYALGSVSGTVTNGNTNEPLQGWTLHLYDPSGTLIRTTTSNENGNYTFGVNFASGTYTICEIPSSGTWAQTTPDPSSPDVCTGSGELPKGQQFSASPYETVTGENFVNVSATACSDSPFGAAGFQIQLAEPCSTKTNTFVFTSGNNVNGTGWAGYWLGDLTQGPEPVVEYVKVKDPVDSSGQLSTTVMYTDDPMVRTLTSGTTLKTMKYCNFDPRSGADNYTLKSAYTSIGTAGPPATGSYAVGLSSTDTSCLISLRTYVDANGQGWAEFYDYSTADTIKTMG